MITAAIGDAPRLGDLVEDLLIRLASLRANAPVGTSAGLVSFIGKNW
jgi:hypothetical protein